MKGLEIEAFYENSTLKLPRQLPLTEGQMVTITIHPPGGVARRGHGLLQSTLDSEELEQAALAPELGLLESP
jgi:predicted DNA-binding antitoxin AbrB/MazE fold protein